MANQNIFFSSKVYLPIASGCCYCTYACLTAEGTAKTTNGSPFIVVTVENVGRHLSYPSKPVFENARCTDQYQYKLFYDDAQILEGQTLDCSDIVEIFPYPCFAEKVLAAIGLVDATVDDGTVTGQMLVWNQDTGKWEATDENLLSFDGTTLTVNQIDRVRSVYEEEFWNAMSAPITPLATRTTTGSVAEIVEDNGWVRLSTGAVATNEESLDFDDYTVYTNTKRPDMQVRFRLGSIDDIEVDLGFMEASGGVDDSFILLSADTSITPNWIIQSSDAGTLTNADTGIPITTAITELKTVFIDDTTVEFFLDGVSLGSISANIPTVPLQPLIAVRTEAASVETLDVDYIKVTQDRT